MGHRSASAIDREDRFVAAIIAGKNNFEAAIAAGYSDRSASQRATEMMRRARVKQLIEAERARLRKKREISADRIMEELASIGYASMKDYVRLDGNGDPHIDLSNLDEPNWAAISQLETETYIEGRGDDATPVKRVRFKLHDKQSALVNLAKMIGVGGFGNPTAPASDAVASDLGEVARRLAYVLTQGRAQLPKVIDADQISEPTELEKD